MKRELLPVIFLTFVNTLNFSILIPILPFIIQQYGGGSFLYGVTLSMYPIFQFFAAPMLGSLSDTYGRRPLLLISQFGTLVSWIIFAAAYLMPEIMVGPLALPLSIIMLSRVADGITGGNNAVASAYISDVTTAKDKTKVFGMMGGIVGFGLIVGPAVGGFVSSFAIGYLGAALTAIGISIVTYILMYMYLPETLSENQKKDHVDLSLKDELNFLIKLQKYANTQRIKLLFFIRFALLLVFTGYTSIIVLFMIDRLGLDQKQLGLLFLVIGLFLVVNQMFLARHIAQKIGEMRTFIIGIVVMSIALFTLQWVETIPGFLVNAYIMNVGISISMPTFKSLLSNSVSEKKQGEILGIDESILAATSAIAPIGAGYLYGVYGVYTFGICAVGMALAFMWFVWKYKSRK